MKGLGILCPGQGNQHQSMFDKLLGCSEAESAMQSASSFFPRHPIEYLQQLSPQDLFSNHPAQLLIGTLQMATWAALREKLPSANVFAGYSMGELVAYGCAGALNVEDTLVLMAKRAKLMDEATRQPSGLMAIRGLSKEQIDFLCCSTGAEIAIVNGPDHFVVGGTNDALVLCEKHPLSTKATTIKWLQVTVPSHTSRLSEASGKFNHELNASHLTAPIQPVLAGVSGYVVRTREQAVTALTQQISSPINWMTCMQAASEMGCNVMMELGPGNALTKMMLEYFPRVTVRSVADFRSLQGVVDWVCKQFD